MERLEEGGVRDLGASGGKAGRSGRSGRRMFRRMSALPSATSRSAQLLSTYRPIYGEGEWEAPVAAFTHTAFPVMEVRMANTGKTEK